MIFSVYREKGLEILEKKLNKYQLILKDTDQLTDDIYHKTQTHTH